MSTQRIPSLPLNETTGQTRQILDDVNRTLNIVPNLYGVMAHSPATLQGYLALGRVREHGLLSKPLQERIALTVAQANQCDYCLSAHTALAKQVGLTEEQILRSREADASDPKTRAALQFARLMVVDRGNVSEAEFAQLRDAGFSHGEIVEIVFNVTINIMTNYLNHVANTVVDFPAVPALEWA